MESPQNGKSSGGLFGVFWGKTGWLFGLIFCAVIMWFAFKGTELPIKPFGIFFTVTGIGVLLYSMRARSLQHESLSWMPAQGTITLSEIEEEMEIGRVSSQVDTVNTCRPRIEYTYHFQGKPYTSRRIITMDTNWPLEEVKELISRYPVGSPVTVWVDPGNPELAVLEKGMLGHEKRYKALFITGAVFLLLGIIGWLAAPLLVL